MRRAHAIALCLALAACGSGSEDAPEGPTTELESAQLGPVVARHLAELDARIQAEAVAPPEAPEDLEERISGLLETASHEREEMASLVLDELTELGDAATAGLAVRLLDRELPAAQRRAAADVLARIDTPASAQVLLDVLIGARADKSTETWLTAQCAWRLGQTSQDWVVPRLGLCLKYEKDHQTVVWIADTLARFGVLAGLKGLFAIERAPATPEVGQQASAILERLREELECEDWFALDALWREGQVERLPAVQRSARYQREVWQQIGALGEWQLRWVDDGRFALSALREDAAEMMAAALEDESVYVRLHSAQCLERMGPRGHVAGQALERLVADVRVGDQAIAALGAVGYAPAEPLILAGLEQGAGLPRRVSCARALAGLGVEGLESRLAALLVESEPIDLRVAAAGSLVRLGSATRETELQALDILCNALTSGEVAPREAELSLEAWLERPRPAPDPQLATLHEAWLALPAEPIRERLAARAQLLRAGPLAAASE